MKKHASLVRVTQPDFAASGRAVGTSAVQRLVDGSRRQSGHQDRVVALQQSAKVAQRQIAPVAQRLTFADARAFVARLTAPREDFSYKVSSKVSGEEVERLLKGAEMAAWHTRAYHATKLHNVPSILAQGLDPARGGSGAAEGHPTFEAHSQGHVHYARNIETARDYQQYFSGEGTPFGSRRDPAPAPAEILAVNLPYSARLHEEKDPDSVGENVGAYRSQRLIPKEAIRSLTPVPIPQGYWGGQRDDHQRKGEYENNALYSNLPAEVQQLVATLVGEGLDKNVIMHCLKQGMLSMPACDATSMKQNMRARGGLGSRVNAMGEFFRSLGSGS